MDKEIFGFDGKIRRENYPLKTKSGHQVDRHVGYSSEEGWTPKKDSKQGTELSSRFRTELFIGPHWRHFRETGESDHKERDDLGNSRIGVRRIYSIYLKEER